MKVLFRLQSGPLCYTIEEWAFRNSWTWFCFSIALVGIFSWISTFDVEDPATYVTTKAVVISIAVIFSIVALFSFIMVMGILKKNVKLLKIWIFYGFFMIFVLFFGSLGFGIYICTLPESLVGGIVLIVVGWIITGSNYHTILIVHSLRCIYKDKARERNELPT